MARMKLNWKFITPAAGFSVFMLMIYAYYHHPSCGLGYMTNKAMSHIYEYCNSIYVHKLDQEGTVPSAEYKLVSVHVVIRHGDRTNLHSIANYRDLTIGCELTENHGVMNGVPEMKAYAKFMQGQSRRQSEQTFANRPLHPDKKKCESSELTPTGAAQHVQNGLLMKKRYLDNLKLINEGNLYEEILIRSTDYSRTYQSALALLYGLLGDNFDVTQLEIEQAMNSALCYEKQGHLPCDCPIVRPFLNTMSSTYHQLYADVMANRRTVRVIDHFASVFNIPSSKVPKVSNLFDFSMIHVCNKMPLPGPPSDSGYQQCIEPWAIKDVYNVMQENGEKQAKSADYQKIARLRALPLLDEIKNRMVLQANGDSGYKFVLYSGHDSSINTLAIALNFTKGHWPSYASRIVLELYSSPKSDIFVRVLYNGKMVTTDMEFCKEHIHSNKGEYESGLCPLTVFNSYIDEKILNDMEQDTYNAACQLKSLS